MAEAIGSVRATFTASAGGLVGAVNESVAALDGMRSAQRTTAAAFADSASRSRQAQQSVSQSVQASSAMMRDAARITREARTPAEQYADTVRKLDAYLSRGLLTQEVYSRAVAKAEKQMRAAQAANSDLVTAMSKTERVFGIVASAVQKTGEAIGSFARGGSAVISFGEDLARAAGEIVAATTAWRAFNAVTSAFKTPEGIWGIATGVSRALVVIKLGEVALNQLGVEADGAAAFATKATLAFGAFKAAMALGVADKIAPAVQAFGATLPAALARVGVSVGVTNAAMSALGTVGSVVGPRLTSVALMSIPGFGQLAATGFLVGKAMFSARDRAYEMASAITEGKVRVEELAASLGTVQAQQIDNLAFAMEEVTAAGQRSQQAFAGLRDVFVTPFIGAFAALNSGFAGFKDGISGVVEGVTSIASPIAQAIAPVFTLIGTAIEGVMKLVGALGETIGVVLQVAGAFTRTLLSPVIVGLTNVVEAIRSGMNSAFEYVGSLIDSVTAKIQAFYAFMSKVPVIGGAFASGEKVAPEQAATSPASGLAQNADAAKAQAEAMKEAAREEEQAAKSISDAIRTQEAALSDAILKAQDFGQAGFDAAVQYQEQLRKLEAQLEAGILNETSFADAARQAKAAFDSQIQSIEDRNKAAASITAEIDKSAKAGAGLGAAADPIRAAFQQTAEAIKSQVEKGIISPEDAKKQMGDAVDAMNEELKRLGEDQKFAEKIRDGFKTAADKAKEELDAIDKNQTLTAAEKEKAKGQVRDKFAEGLPGEKQKDAADKFREDQAKLKEALDKGLIDPAQFRERQEAIREELESSVADLKDKQERNKGPDRRAVSAVDVNSSAGASTFFRLLRGQDEPTKRQLEEAKRQTRLLERIAAAEKEVVQI